ncbi:MAG TPA: hypothetical protein VH370_18130 [Humisphaera sp.]|jgi:hypothetical protein|nr:hypothetical protein [Humisphaera sp.]
MDDPLLQALEDFTNRTGRFSARKDHDAVSEYDFRRAYTSLFLPYLNGLKTSEQRHLVVLLAQIATSAFSVGNRVQANAKQLLRALKYPWPKDNRVLLEFARDILWAEFTRESNIGTWVN